MTDEFLSERFRPSGQEILEKENLSDLYVYYDGFFLKGKEARVIPFDPGWLNSFGIFEGIRAYDGNIFKLDQHINRLFDSATGIGLKVPLTKDELKEAIILTARKNNLKNCHIRPVVTRGPGKLGMDPRRGVRASILILAYPFAPLHGEKPVRAMISSVRRKSPLSVDGKLKSLAYIDFIVALVQAAAMGMDDAILLDQDGYVGEGCGANIAIIKNDKLVTPPPTAALQGITIETLLEICPKLGIRATYEQITPLQLYTADEAFLCGTGAEIAPIAEIDGRKIGTRTPGPVTEKLRDRYFKVVRSEDLTSIY